MEHSQRVTLARLAALASVLHRLRVLWVVVGLAAAGWFAYLLVQPAVPSARALVPLTVLVWMALALATAFTLTRPPPAVSSADRFLHRIRKRVLQGVFGLAVATVLVLAGLALFLSWRAISLAAG